MNSELTFILTTLLGALLVMPLARIKEGTWLNAATLYSFGWFSAIFCYRYASLVSQEDYIIPDSSFEFGTLIVAGGFVGVFLGQLFFKSRKGNYNAMKQNFLHLGDFLDRYYLIACIVIFIFGMIAFVDRFSQVGFNIFAIQDLRSLHVHSRFSFPQRLGVLGNLALSVVVGLSAVDDTLRRRVNATRLMIIIITLLPLAFSKGSRQEFLNPVIIYFVHVFIVMRARSIDLGVVDFNYIFKLSRKLLPLLILLFIFFTIYGEIRTVASKSSAGRYEVFSLAEAPVRVSGKVTAWLASSLYSLGPIANYEDDTFPRMNGRILLEPVFKIPQKLGLIPDTSVIIYYAKQDAFQYFKRGTITFTPGTMGKVLTREVGMKWAPYLGALVMFILVAISSRVKPISILSLTLVFLCSWQILMTFQTLQGLNMSILYRILFALLIGVFYSKFTKSIRRV